MRRAADIGRLLLGAWMLIAGIDHFLFSFLPMPSGATSQAAQLLGAFIHSGLFDVATGIQLIAGLLLLARVAVPFALAALMPVNTCALYWAVWLDREPVWAVLAATAFALNALLMVAHIDRYRDLLAPGALAFGETAQANYGRLLVDPRGLARARRYPAALATVLAALAFYLWFVPFANGTYGALVLLFPLAIVLIGWARSALRRA